MEKYLPLKIDFEIPEDLQNDIDNFLHCINYNNKSLEDCYRTEIQCTLNWCYREKLLTDDQIHLLREYYQWGGIYKLFEKEGNADE